MKISEYTILNQIVLVIFMVYVSNDPTNQTRSLFTVDRTLPDNGVTFYMIVSMLY